MVWRFSGCKNSLRTWRCHSSDHCAFNNISGVSRQARSISRLCKHVSGSFIHHWTGSSWCHLLQTGLHIHSLCLCWYYFPCRIYLNLSDARPLKPLGRRSQWPRLAFWQWDSRRSLLDIVKESKVIDGYFGQIHGRFLLELLRSDTVSTSRE